VHHLRPQAALELAHRADELLEQGDRDVGHAADAQERARHPGPAGLRDREVEAGEHLARLLGEDASGLGRGHAAARALEELHAELLLEPPDRLRQRRLGDPQPLGRPVEVQLLDDRQEVPEMAKPDGGRDAHADGHGREGEQTDGAVRTLEP
jgi:hypothetical protein